MIFTDTNILVYASEPAKGEKCKVAVELLREASHGSSLVLSTQVLQEFYSTVMRNRLLSGPEALETLRDWADQAVVVPTTTELVLQAISLQQRMQLSIWDALIVQAALQAGCRTLFTEDLHNGLKIGDLEIVNPFAHSVHEGRAEYLHASRLASVDKVLRQAIAQKRLVSLAYERRLKQGEPHDYGRIKGKLRLNFFQIDGQSRTGEQESNVWKTLDPAKITQLRLLPDRFPGTRDAPSGAHKRWDELIATVTLR